MGRAEEGVQFAAIEAGAPLGQANRFLAESRRDYASKGYAKTRCDLHWLDRVKGQTLQSEVERLSLRLGEPVRTLEQGGKDLTNALESVEDQAAAMAERVVEKAATD